jgi:DNA-binding response OmpR family regulator
VVDEQVPEQAADEAHAISAGEHRVLIVDDNKDSADALAALLDLHGYQCRVAYDGAGALVMAGAFAPTVGVIDLGLPDMSGFDVASAIRKQFDGAPLTLVALSGYSSADYRHNAKQAGFDHYFAKPLLIGDFLTFLSTLDT